MVRGFKNQEKILNISKLCKKLKKIITNFLDAPKKKKQIAD